MRLLALALVASLVAGACRGGGAAKTQTPLATASLPSGSPTPAPVPTIDPATAGTGKVTLPGSPFGGTLKAIRIGLHPELGGWDRIVFEFEGGLPSAEVEYVQSAVGCGSGLPVAVQGQAILAVRFEPAAAHDDQGQLTIPSNTVPGQGGVIVETKAYCDFEAVVQWAVGLKAKQPFKVTTLQNPPRLAIDIKQ